MNTTNTRSHDGPRPSNVSSNYPSPKETDKDYSMKKAAIAPEGICTKNDPIEMQINLSVGIADPAHLYKAATERWLLEGDTPDDAREIFGTPEAPNLIRCVMEFVDFSSIPVEITDWK